MVWFSLSDYEKYCSNITYLDSEINYAWPNTKHDIWSVWLSLGLIKPLDDAKEFYYQSNHQPILYEFTVFDNI